MLFGASGPGNARNAADPGTCQCDTGFHLEDVGRVKLISTLWGWDVYAIPESICLVMKGD